MSSITVIESSIPFVVRFLYESKTSLLQKSYRLNKLEAIGSPFSKSRLEVNTVIDVIILAKLFDLVFDNFPSFSISYLSNLRFLLNSSNTIFMKSCFEAFSNFVLISVCSYSFIA